MGKSEVVMSSVYFIKSVDDCYKALVVTDYWEQPSTDVCRNIVKFLNEYITNNSNDARAYYLRSMAKFHLMGLIPPDYFWYTGSEYAKDKTWNKDDDYDDYNTAISIDPEIVTKNPDVRVIIVSSHSGLKYYFRKPCHYKILDKMLMYNDPMSWWVGILIIVMVASFIIGSILHFLSMPDKYIAPFAIAIFVGLILVLIMNIYRRKMDSYINKLQKEYCEEVVPATYAEIK